MHLQINAPQNKLLIEKINEKSILVFTDFSCYARNAGETAIFIASLLNNDIILVNMHSMATTLSSTEVPFPIEYYDLAEKDSKKGLKSEKKDFR